MSKRIVCIALVTAAEGSSVGHMVAQQLGFRYLDEEIIALAAEHGHVDPKPVADVEKRTSLVHRLVEAIFSSSVLEGHYFPLKGDASGKPHHEAAPRVDRDELRTLIREAIHSIADRG